MLTVSCGSDYLDTNPTGSIGESTATESLDNMNYILTGVNNYAYQYRFDQGFGGGEPNFGIARDMLGEDVINTTTGNGWFIAETRWLGHRVETTTYASYPYQFYYRIILNANVILDKVDKMEGDPALKARVKGESLAFRAWGHFNLVQLYAKRYNKATASSDVGIVLRETVSQSPKARATVEETYAFINKDMDEALKNLAISNNPSVNHISLKVANGIKARIALTMGDWATAEQFAQKAIDAAGGKTGLQSGKDLLSGFNSISKNKEWMWAYTQTTDQNLFFGSFFAYMSWNYNSTNIRTNPKAINSKLFSAISSTDIRAKWWDQAGKGLAEYPRPATFTNKPYQTYKFTAQDLGNSSGDFLFMRLAEMYLIKAEAQAMQNKTAEASQTLYDIIVTRDPNYTKSTKSGSDLLTEILTHRRIELWGEGFRFLDLKRLNLPLDRRETGSPDLVAVKMQVPAGDKEWVFLIPRSEIDASKGLIKQNEL